MQIKINHCRPQHESLCNPSCKLQKGFLHQDMHKKFQIKNICFDCTLITCKIVWFNFVTTLALFACLMRRIFSAKKHRFSLTTNQSTVFFSLSFQQSEYNMSSWKDITTITCAHSFGPLVAADVWFLILPEQMSATWLMTWGWTRPLPHSFCACIGNTWSSTKAIWTGSEC